MDATFLNQPAFPSRSLGLVPQPMRRSCQRGLTLIELMISMVIGLFLVAGLAVLIASQSGARAEVDKAGRLIENGRYAIQSLTQDIQLAGYWGELTTLPAVPGTLPDPCALTASAVQAAMAISIQAYNAPVTSPLTCLTNHKPGTDILVIRRADTDIDSIKVSDVVDITKLTAGQMYLQTGLNPAGLAFTSVLQSSVPASDATTFNLNRTIRPAGATVDTTTRANIRKVLVQIYYISQCSVPIGTSCTGADGGSPIPTLKRLDLSAGPAFTNTSIAEGIENFQVDYGVDADNNGTPDGADVSGAALQVADWPNVMTVRLHLLARSLETTPGHSDTKTYTLGTAGTTTATNDQYKRHVFVQTVRLVNPSGRRQL